MPESPFSHPLNWRIKKGEIWTVTGENGSGKSLLSEILVGRYALQEGQIDYHFLEEWKNLNPVTETLLPRNFIKIVHFNGVYSLSGFKEVYYQQRFNQSESDDIPFVSDLFSAPQALRVIELLNIQKLLNRRLNHLSSGELRKLLIAKALMENPQMLIFDNPFIGLDVASREQLNTIFLQLHANGIQLLFLAPSPKDIPPCTTHIQEMQNCKIVWQGEAKGYAKLAPRTTCMDSPEIDWSRFPAKKRADYEVVVSMDDVEIAYGEIVINSGIDWIIRRGEKWALLGPNGSGKSTLLSYIFADNPQAYAKKLSLFDRRRGSGESIWEIKERIGFTSSEMHLYYRQNVACLSVVASGFFDSIGLYRKCTDEQMQLAEYLFDVFSIGHLKSHSFLKISSGEQRLILFARALIKNPDLLILDEPFHGLDMRYKHFCTQVIESFCRQPDKSLIYVTHLQEEIPASVNHQLQLSHPSGL